MTTEMFLETYVSVKRDMMNHVLNNDYPSTESSVKHKRNIINSAAGVSVTGERENGEKKKQQGGKREREKTPAVRRRLSGGNFRT